VTRVCEPVTYSVHDEAMRADADVVDTGIGEYNDAAAPLHQVQPLQAFARSASGEVIGGAVGRTWGTCCELLQLWVHEGYRRQGIATRIMEDFERRAVERGCRTFYLETFSFQAPAFYRALGYVSESSIEGYAPGIARFAMVKRLR